MRLQRVLALHTRLSASPAQSPRTARTDTSNAAQCPLYVQYDGRAAGAHPPGQDMRRARVPFVY
eukprot:scaffold3134_cov414-Prasinococcus_capsulatus_cf.AAC.20